jgi:uncharacterized membrane protein YbhN (UPF0104 family)
MRAFALPASVPLAMLSGGIASFATLLPSAPGFVGTFDAALVKLLTDVQGISLNAATSYALVVHTIIVVPVVVLGVLVLWRADLSLGHVIAASFRSRGYPTPEPAPAATS